jgi:hypothetical protein
LATETQTLALKLQPNLVLDGRKLSHSEAQALEEELDAVLTRISEASKIITNPDQSWLEPPAIQSLDDISVAQVLDEWGIRGQVRRLLEVDLENDNVAPLSQQSWLGLLCQVRGGSRCSSSREFWDIQDLFRCANVRMANILRLPSEDSGVHGPEYYPQRARRDLPSHPR